MKSGTKYGLVLCGGGAKGAYQIGVWRALRERGYEAQIHGVSGTSVGALNAFLFASGDLDRAERIWKNISPEIFLKRNSGDDALFTRSGMQKIIRQYDYPVLLEHASYPIYVTVTNTMFNRAEYKELHQYQPDIEQYLLASSALPIAYPPERIGGIDYIDGGVHDNMPVVPLYQEGFRDFIIVGLSDNNSIDPIFRRKFPGANLILIRPSSSLGKLIDGTLDFSKESVFWRVRMGYMDALAVLQKKEKNMALIQLGPKTPPAYIKKTIVALLGDNNWSFDELENTILKPSNLCHEHKKHRIEKYDWETIYTGPDGWKLQGSRHHEKELRICVERDNYKSYIRKSYDFLVLLDDYAASKGQSGDAV